MSAAGLFLSSEWLQKEPLVCNAQVVLRQVKGVPADPLREQQACGGLDLSGGDGGAFGGASQACSLVCNALEYVQTPVDLLQHVGK